jgi:Mn2+/Fe2+ NRAMP family transporter
MYHPPGTCFTSFHTRTVSLTHAAGGITTYSVAGASYGRDLLWVLPVITVSHYRGPRRLRPTGAVTGEGLSALIREEFGVRWVALAMLSFLVASFGATASEFAGIAAAIEKGSDGQGVAARPC